MDNIDDIRCCSGTFNCPRCNGKETILFLRKGVPFLCHNYGQVTTVVNLLKNGRIKDYEEYSIDNVTSDDGLHERWNKTDRSSKT